MPFFGGGYGVGFFPMFGIGSLFNIMILLFIMNVVFQTVKSFTNSSGDTKKRSDDEEDDRW